MSGVKGRGIGGVLQITAPENVEVIMRRYIPAAAAALAISWTLAQAAYNANMSGVVAEVLTYPETTHVLFRLDNQPTSHPGCNAAYFVMADPNPESRKLMYARLLTALAMGSSINIGYDNVGECGPGGYIRVHRIG